MALDFGSASGGASAALADAAKPKIKGTCDECGEIFPVHSREGRDFASTLIIDGRGV